MIETAEAVDNLEEICRTDGVDGVYIGPKDLGLALNLPPGEELESVVAEIARRAGACGTPAGIHTRGGSGARAYAEAGFLWAAVATDREFLFEASRTQFEEALGGSAVVSPTVESPLLRATTSYVVTGR
jgi:4-hydroxy-2-oxoheptanedioate aldolase